MSAQIIELNDTGILLGDDSGILLESPGYAVIDGKRLLVGEQAMREARRNPRHTSSQFWQHLSMDALPQPGAGARTLADLAHAHLQHIWDSARPASAEVILALPGQFDRAQMGLLLGIMQQSPFQAVGLVDAALAAASSCNSLQDTVLHLDLQLHQCVLTHIEAGTALQRQSAEDIGGLGSATLADAWVHLIADAFIRETRFDALHDAGSEQRLYDALPDWLAQLTDQDEVTVQANGGNHRLQLSRAQFVERVLPRYEALLDSLQQARRSAGGGPATVLLSERLARLPGLLAMLRGSADLDPIVLPRDAAVRGALEHQALIRQDGQALAFVTRLPRPADAAAPSAKTPEPSAKTPEPSAKKSEPSAKAPEPSARKSEPSAKKSEPSAKKSDPSAKQSEPPAKAPESAARASDPSPEQQQESASQTATHVLAGQQAHPLPASGLLLGIEGPVADAAEALAYLQPAQPSASNTGGWTLTPLGGQPLQLDGEPVTAKRPFIPGQLALLGAQRLRLELIAVLEPEAP